MKNKIKETVNLKKKLENFNFTLCGSREKSKAKKNNNINLRLLCSKGCSAADRQRTTGHWERALVSIDKHRWKTGDRHEKMLKSLGDYGVNFTVFHFGSSDICWSSEKKCRRKQHQNCFHETCSVCNISAFRNLCHENRAHL